MNKIGLGVKDKLDSSFFALFKRFSILSLVFLSGNLIEFVNAIFLSYYSLDAFEAATAALYLCFFIQAPLIHMGSMTQVFVASRYGKKEYRKIGPIVWQMIWVMCLSIFFIIPLGFIAKNLAFGGTLVETLSTQYLNILIPVSFLFPLGTVLSSFYIGQGKSAFVLKMTILSHLINAVLNYLLIYGIGQIVPAMGIRGAAVAALLAQSFLCLILFAKFIELRNHEKYNTRHLTLHFSSLLQLLKLSIPRGVSKLVMTGSWLIVTHIFLTQGPLHTLVLSIGGRLFAFFVFINDGMMDALTSLLAHFMGAQRWEKVWKLIRISYLLLIIIGVMAAFPYLIFPKLLLSFLLKEPVSLTYLQSLIHSIHWLWIFFIADGVHRIFKSLLLASSDTLFYMLYQGISVWFTSVLPIYIGIHIWHFPPEILWRIIACESCLTAWICYLRAKKERWKKTPLFIEAKEHLIEKS